ncbi:hypothetical protein E3N88_38567 [Mikania micrantha]|uniref:Uncharacterized protein n=1 Tax=Mikania micrantha TaxID=192012 RepID=A0A5N6LUN0_9ASTR|nr:hypothetical protein E3N88_38567 [Mikania micrantha]
MEAGEKGKAHEEPNTVTMEAGEDGLRFRGVDENGLIKTLVFESPNGTRYWKPDVISDEKPTVGMVFQTWDDAYNFYNSYAELSDSQRLRTYTVCNCKARLKLKVVKQSSTFVVYEFHETHNHDLLSAENADFSKSRRHLSYRDKHFIHWMSLHKVGPRVAHQLKTGLCGCPHNMRGTTTDYMNFGCEIRKFISERDAKMFVEMLDQRYKKVEKIPDEFIIKRWTKNLLPSNLFSSNKLLGGDNSEMSLKRNELMDLVTQCIDCLMGDVEEFDSFFEKIKDMKQNLFEKLKIEAEGIRNKGSRGTKRRVVGPYETIAVNRKKTLRKCRTCQELVYHDTSNCPLNNEDCHSDQA